MPEPEAEIIEASDNEYFDSWLSYGSEASSDEEEDEYIPRHMIAAYKEVHGKNIKQVTGKDMKLTEGTDPTKILKLSFLVNDGIACPSFLPMEPSDCQLSANVIFANLMNPDIPMSELMRKEFYYDCIQNFR